MNAKHFKSCILSIEIKKITLVKTKVYCEMRCLYIDIGRVVYEYLHWERSSLNHNSTNKLVIKKLNK